MTKPSGLNPSSPSLESYTSLPITRLFVLCFACLTIFKQKGWNPVSGGIQGILTSFYMPIAQGLSGKLPIQPQATHSSQPAPGRKPLSPAIGEGNWVPWQGDGSAKVTAGQSHDKTTSMVMRARRRCPQLPMDVLARIPVDADLSVALMTKVEAPQAPQINCMPAHNP